MGFEGGPIKMYGPGSANETNGSGAVGPSIKFDMKLKHTAEGPASSRAGLVVCRLEQWMEKNAVPAETFNSEDAVKQAVIKNRLLLPGVTAEDIIVELKKMGVITAPPAPKKIATPPAKIETEYVKLGVTKVEDSGLQKQFEENQKFFEELAKDVFRNEKELSDVHRRALSLGRENSAEKSEYYYEFADAGLIKGGREEVARDMASLAERQEQFRQKNDGQEKSKQIATIVESAVAYSVTELGWYGDKVSIERASQFDDVKRGVDDVLEIRREDDASKFLALGIDVTYTGINSEKYKEKVFTLLHSIKEGYKTKIKYFKNHKGEMMPEFSVPKTVLSFDVNDVKELANMIKNIDNPDARKEYKNSPIKFDVLNQMLVQCKLLLSFAEECNNNISVQYNELLTSIERLSQKDSEIKKMLGERKEDEVSKRLKSLVIEFKHIPLGRSSLAQAA